MLVSFDPLDNPDRPFNGQYPVGVIDWGNDAWYLSSAYGKFPGNSISFNGSERTSARFTFHGSRTLISLDADNGGDDRTTVTVSCAGLPTSVTTLGPHELKTIVVGWTRPCETVTISSSNGWQTNFNNLRIK
jgi:hypothetical protein